MMVVTHHAERSALLMLVIGAAFLWTSPAAAQQAPLRLIADRTQIEEGEAVTFTVEAAPQIPIEPSRGDDVIANRRAASTVVYVIAFGDGEEQRLESPRAVHRYERAGRFRAVVRLERSGGTVSTSRPVVISVAPQPLPPPTVGLVADQTAITAGERVTFSAGVEPSPARLGWSARSVRYVFAFGDGNQQVSREPRAVWAYQRSGRFRASVQVLRDGEGVATSRPVEVSVAQVEQAPPSVRLLVRSQNVTEGERVDFTAVVDPPAAAGAYDYVFDFGDGEGEREGAARGVHVYDRPGRFDASVQLLRRGEPIARSRPLAMTIAPRVVPSDPPDPPDPDPPGPDLSDDGPQQDVVPSDDVTQPNDAQPDGGGTPSIQLSATSDVVLVGNQVTFAATADLTSGGESYVFAFSDRPEGEPSPSPRLTRTFEEVGTVVASVQLVRGGEILAESEPISVTVTAPPPAVVLDLFVGPESPRPGDAVSFWTSGVAADSAVEYRFHFGDGETSGWLREGRAEHTYAAAGAYDAQVEVRGLAGVAGPVSSRVVRVAVGAARASVPLWLLLVIAALVLLGALAWYVRKRRGLSSHGLPPPLVGLKTRHDGGTIRVAADRPLAVEWEVRVRPVHDPGSHRIETREVVAP